MKSILIVSHVQFGYHTGTYEYCKHLRHKFKVTYLGFNYNQPSIELDDITIINLDRSKNLLLNSLRFSFIALKFIWKHKYDRIFIHYFITCLLIKFFSPKSKFILDIRTSFIYDNKILTWLYNFILKRESFFFKNITIISEGLIDFLDLQKEKCHILPLGAPNFNFSDKLFSEIQLLYVGTFFDRNLHLTLVGLKQFMDVNPSVKIHYHIIGFGDSTKILETVKLNKLDNIVSFYGEIRYPELSKYFDLCNIGVSFIPLKSCYDIQPPTKTFEYLLSGMAVIATSTMENKKVINDKNGVLISDNPESFCKGLESLYNRFHKYDSRTIKENAQNFTWENIINNNLIPYLEQL